MLENYRGYSVCHASDVVLYKPGSVYRYLSGYFWRFLDEKTGYPDDEWHGPYRTKRLAHRAYHAL